MRKLWVNANDNEVSETWEKILSEPEFADAVKFCFPHTFWKFKGGFEPRQAANYLWFAKFSHEFSLKQADINREEFEVIDNDDYRKT